MRPAIRVFTRDKPCTKKDIWIAFRRRTGFAILQVDKAHAEIGVNVPRVMEREGRLVRLTVNAVDYYKLTLEGQEWLLRGMANYIRNHPSEEATIPFRRAIR